MLQSWPHGRCAEVSRLHQPRQWQWSGAGEMARSQWVVQVPAVVFYPGGSLKGSWVVWFDRTTELPLPLYTFGILVGPMISSGGFHETWTTWAAQVLTTRAGEACEVAAQLQRDSCDGIIVVTRRQSNVHYGCCLLLNASITGWWN